MINRLSDPEIDRPPYHRPHDPVVVLPNKTKPSLRVRRRNFTAACTAFTLGAIFIICASPMSNEFFVPGPLSSHHAPLMASEGGARCATCHENGSTSLTGWIAHTLFAQSSHDPANPTSQSELCLNCHRQSLTSDFALHPHNVDPQRLAEMTAKHQPAGFADKVSFHPPVNDQNQIACSVCHREHHGGKGLMTLTDSQCQSCHGNSFHSFESGHPEFVSWPQERRSRIAFDHASHFGKHFPEKQTEFNCNQCHIDDAFRNVKRLGSFEQTCAACHDQQIQESNASGLALIALPMLDMVAIDAAGMQVGNWPRDATGDFDGELPPMMRLMLAADPAASEIFQRLGPDFDFYDIDATKRSDVEDAVNLVWAIKRLLLELANDGPLAVQQRLERVLGFEISDQQLQRIITNLDGPVFQNAVKRWLPDLNDELAEHRADALLTSSLLVERNVQESIQKKSPGKSRLQVTRSLPSRAWDRIDWKPGRNDIQANMAVDDTLLAINPLNELMKGNSVDAVRPAESSSDQERTAQIEASETNGMDAIESDEQNLLSPSRPSMTDLSLPLNENQVAAIPKIEPAQDSAVPHSTPLNNPRANRPPLIVPSGWFRNDQSFRISYRPSGHADDCLQSWIELVTRAKDAHARPETKQLFEKTISLTGVGLCRTCHTVDQLADRSFAVNWLAEYRDPAVRSFTKFSHGPHLIQPELTDCSHCHQLDQLKFNAESFLSVDPQHVVSNFLPMTTADCTSCHQQGRTSNGCTQCHNYHVGSQVIGSQ